MKKQAKITRLPLIFTTLLVLAGCWDMEEIDQRAYVLGIGLDKSDVKGFLQITYLISNPEAGSTQQGGGSNEPSHEIITLNASSFIQSENLANAVIAKAITYDILDFFVVSEELARDKDFIRFFYDATKDRDVRRDSKLIITKEKASTFIEQNKPKLETRRHEYFETIFKNASKIGFIPTSEINNFFRITEADADLFISAYATTEQDKNTAKKNEDEDFIAGKMKVTGKTNPAQFLGSAVFKEGQMIGKLSVQETRITKMLHKSMEKPSFLVTLPDPFMKDYWITSRFSQIKKPQITVDVSGHPPKIKVNLPINADILTDHSMVNYADQEKKREELKVHITKGFEKRINDYVQRTQEEFKADPFGFSFVARKHFLTIPEWENYDWMRSYPDADIRVNVEITFGEFGRQSKLPTYEKIRD
ncbi:Ger(x)C family spore germination protein [Bacillus sp. REN16]|uniref:Ger(x)C family spore germination protein n=1 Tax=Bacillus sp. REN16 TaxID=2887296 RepID=UPI001E408494|nr:Ger(x)C family spore germination protein [Bacillus sp. REN16]MCC3356635.1 Ger(x)C family spore germination protein [Bacillus sp. REN16]